MCATLYQKKCWLGATIFLQIAAMILNFLQFVYKVLYDCVYMIDHKEDGERFKFLGSLFGYKPLIINSLIQISKLNKVWNFFCLKNP